MHETTTEETNTENKVFNEIFEMLKKYEGRIVGPALLTEIKTNLYLLVQKSSLDAKVKVVLPKFSRSLDTGKIA